MKFKTVNHKVGNGGPDVVCQYNKDTNENVCYHYNAFIEGNNLTFDECARRIKEKENGN